MRKSLNCERNCPDLIDALAGTSSAEMAAWRRKLTCISGRLEKEMGARRHRHHVSLDADGAASETALDWISRTVHTTFEAESVLLWVLDPGGRDLVARSVAGPRAFPGTVGARQGVHVGSMGRVAGNRRALLLTASTPSGSHAGHEIVAHQRREAMVAPITIGDRFIGVVDVGPRPSGPAYTVEDLETLGFMLEVAAVCCYMAVQCKRARGAFPVDAFPLPERVPGADRRAA